ncbi:MAG: hypothetical protein VE98_C0001G0596 [candidate division Kazan bacterium GW2011_GWA1_50_15]|uniref:Uncharacterized protein n=1 Tax=candidate division Kazan bacterium GW2011_GWA1_50_15 TaxID=1620412 RepID=A0A0G4BBP7_UNCK3|nr:MAG: hypothetical protein VE98_C0001G0596 [candidate division Kazan bacterium GW2011_GWA1_50_15]
MLLQRLRRVASAATFVLAKVAKAVALFARSIHWQKGWALSVV